jgi:hypothetical protein
VRDATLADPAADGSGSARDGPAIDRATNGAHYGQALEYIFATIT